MNTLKTIPAYHEIFVLDRAEEGSLKEFLVKIKGVKKDNLDVQCAESQDPTSFTYCLDEYRAYTINKMLASGWSLLTEGVVGFDEKLTFIRPLNPDLYEKKKGELNG